MILARTKIPALSLKCDICGYSGSKTRPWYSISRKLPEACPNRKCRSREWNGPKKRTVKPKTKIELPKPIRIKGGEDEEF